MHRRHRLGPEDAPGGCFSEGWGLLHGHQRGPRRSHTRGLFHGTRTLAWSLEPWTGVNIIPLYQGAMPYFRFSTVARSLYLGYEEWTRLGGGHANLASYYIVDATR